MLRSLRFQSLAFVAIGNALGYVAASGGHMVQLALRACAASIVAWYCALPVRAAEPIDAAAVRAVVAKLDLRTVQGPAGSQVVEASASQLRLLAPAPVKRTYEHMTGQLTKQGWKIIEQPGSPTVTDDYGQAMLARDGCVLSLSLYPEGEKRTATHVDLLNHGPVDTRKLPRPAGAEALYESQFTTMLVTSGKVKDVAAAFRKALLAAGWREYGPVDAAVAEDADNVSLDFRSGPATVGAFIGVAPAQGGRTTIQLSARLLSDELPWPDDVAKADFSDHGPRLEATSRQPVSELVRWYNGEMKALGWDVNAGWLVVADDAASIAYSQFIEPRRNLMLRLTATESGTKISIEPISSEALVKLAQDEIEPAEPPAEAEMPTDDEPPAAEAEGSAPLFVRSLPLPEGAEGVHYDEDENEVTFGCPAAIKEIVRFYRAKLVGEDWKEDRRFSVVTEQAASFSLEGPGEAELSFTLINTGLGDGTAVTISVEGMSFARPERPLAEAGEEMPAEDDKPPAEEELTAEDKDGLPIPSNNTQYSSENTQFRRVVTASTPTPLDKIVAFYRRELSAGGWQEDTQAARIAADAATLRYTGPEGPLALSIKRAGDETQIELETRSPEKARKAGLLPKPGKGRVVFGNPGEQDVKVTFGGSPFTIKRGVGAEAPDGPGYDVPPGKYTIKVEVPGQDVQTEKVEIKSDETWGVMVGTELGVLAIRVY